jgi:stage V sporulation protein AE
MWLSFLKAFVAGGVLCAIGQILIDKTALTPARILVSYVVAGIILSAVGIYAPFLDWAGAGASVPLTGFGNVLAKGVKKAVDEKGWLGVLSGSMTAAACGLSSAIFFSFIFALIKKPKEKP